MLKGVSKAFFRIGSSEEALDVLHEAVRTARTPPAGPVSVEIPIDVQGAAVEMPASLAAPKTTRTPAGAGRSRCAGQGGRRRAPAHPVARRRRARRGIGRPAACRYGRRHRHQHQRPRRRAGDPSADARRLQRRAAGRGVLRQLRSHGRRRLAAARQRDPEMESGPAGASLAGGLRPVDGRPRLCLGAFRPGRRRGGAGRAGRPADRPPAPPTRRSPAIWRRRGRRRRPGCAPVSATTGARYWTQ